MLQVPVEIQKQFDAQLHQKAIPAKNQSYFNRWLRYYLDFCNKYNHPSKSNQSLPIFIQKLRDKKQQEFQLKQAAHAISIYYEIVQSSTVKKKPSEPVEPSKDEIAGFKSKNTKNNSTAKKLDSEPPIRKEATANSPAPKAKTQKNCSWVKAYDELQNEIKLRHYSPKTLKSYRGWISRFQTYTASKSLETLTDEDMKNFLTFLAVEKNSGGFHSKPGFPVVFKQKGTEI